MKENKENFVNLQMGKNELKKRDLITLSLHYGAIDRWLIQDREIMQVINTSNRKNIKIGDKVKLADSVFTFWIKLLTMVDRSDSRKYDNHAKGTISYLAQKTGYKDKSGFYKPLKVLYDVGLADIKEHTHNGDSYTDIIVYPYPIYADSDICDLIRIREWEKRESMGMLFSRIGVKARQKEPVDKSQREPVDKSQREPVDKSQREPVDKSQREPVDKSQRTNIYNITNDLITNIYNHHLMKEFTRDEQIELGRFLGIHRIDDDDTITEFLQRIIDFPPKTNSKVKYFKTVLDSIMNNRKPKNKRTEKVPDWYEEHKNRYRPSEEVLTFETTEEFLKAKRELEERLKKYK